MEYFGRIVSYEANSEGINDKVAIMPNDKQFQNGTFAVNCEFNWCKLPGLMEVSSDKIKLHLFDFKGDITGMIIKYYILYRMN